MPEVVAVSVWPTCRRAREIAGWPIAAVLVVVVPGVPVPACDQSLSVSPFFACTCTE